MEDIKEPVTPTEAKVEKVEEVTATAGAEVKTFTQEELDNIVKDRIARVEKKLPSKDELAKFNEWKESQKTEAERQAEVLKEIEQYKMEKEQIAKENILLKKGVKQDDLDYVAFKISKMEGEFEENLVEFLTNNPKFIETKEEVKQTTGVKSTGITQKDDGVISVLKQRHPELF
jgi:hypothetical protein